MNNTEQQKDWSAARLFTGVFILLASSGLIFVLSFLLANHFNYIDKLLLNLAVVNPDSPDPAAEGRPVFIQGEISTDTTIEDPIFGVKVNALYLWRRVEIYQKESEKGKNRSAGESERLSFADINYPESGNNPFLPFRVYNRKAGIGSLTLTDEVLAGLGNFKSYMFTLQHTENLKFAPPREKPFIYAGGIDSGSGKNEGRYIIAAADKNSDSEGDLRVSFYYTAPGLYSIIARQQGNRLAPLKEGEGAYAKKVYAAPGRVSPRNLVSSDLSLYIIFNGTGIFFLFLGCLTGAAVLQPVMGRSLGMPVKNGNFMGGDLGLFSIAAGLLITIVAAGVPWLIV